MLTYVMDIDETEKVLEAALADALQEPMSADDLVTIANIPVILSRIESGDIRQTSADFSLVQHDAIFTLLDFDTNGANIQDCVEALAATHELMVLFDTPVLKTAIYGDKFKINIEATKQVILKSMPEEIIKAMVIGGDCS